MSLREMVGSARGGQHLATRESPQSDIQSQFDAENETSLKIKQCIRMLASADGASKVARAELDRFARVRGYYLVAMEMQVALDSASMNDVASTKRARIEAYSIAAGYIVGHLHAEIARGIRANKPIGPNIFRQYCNEMLDCWFNAGKPLDAAEHVFLLRNRLLQYTVQDASLSVPCLDLVCAVLDTYAQWARQYMERTVAKRRRTRQRTDYPEPHEIVSVHTEHLVNEIICRMDAELRVVRRLQQATAAIQPQHEYGGGEALLNALVAAATREGYRPLTATLYERIGLMQKAVSHGTRFEMLSRAADDHCVLSDAASQLGLLQLARLEQDAAKRDAFMAHQQFKQETATRNQLATNAR